MTSAFTTKALLKNSLSAHTKNPSSSGNITQPPPSSTPGMVITKKLEIHSILLIKQQEFF